MIELEANTPEVNILPQFINTMHKFLSRITIYCIRFSAFMQLSLSVMQVFEYCSVLTKKKKNGTNAINLRKSLSET